MGASSAAGPARGRRWTRVARRRRVAQLRAQGVAIRQIARLLEVAVSTVERDLAALELRGGAVPPEARGRTSRRTPPAPDPPPVVAPLAAPPAGRAREAVALAGRLGALAHAYTEGVRADLERQLTDARRQLADQRCRAAQELAAAKAQGERWRRDLEARLAVQTARAEELQERVALAERRAEVAIGGLRGLERRVPPADLVGAALAPALTAAVGLSADGVPPGSTRGAHNPNATAARLGAGRAATAVGDHRGRPPQRGHRWRVGAGRGGGRSGDTHG